MGSGILWVVILKHAMCCVICWESAVIQRLLATGLLQQLFVYV